ncbi:hypothetical protein [Methylobrevis albus]|uniref:Uncharacterized protein n=1 Tax=Methylobrevis albus TaxID=2793297 RepID=A0A931I0W2_9HYPH|nr:hypothetical protein [Methylobrevis albus]MBH0237275.1 hypothetical protein [Methylobrevis albus]
MLSRSQIPAAISTVCIILPLVLTALVTAPGAVQEVRAETAEEAQRIIWRCDSRAAELGISEADYESFMKKCYEEAMQSGG